MSTSVCLENKATGYIVFHLPTADIARFGLNFRHKNHNKNTRSFEDRYVLKFER